MKISFIIDLLKAYDKNKGNFLMRPFIKDNSNIAELRQYRRHFGKAPLDRELIALENFELWKILLKANPSYAAIKLETAVCVTFRSLEEAAKDGLKGMTRSHSGSEFGPALNELKKAGLLSFENFTALQAPTSNNNPAWVKLLAHHQLLTQTNFTNFLNITWLGLNTLFRLSDGVRLSQELLNQFNEIDRDLQSRLFDLIGELTINQLVSQERINLLFTQRASTVKISNQTSFQRFMRTGLRPCFFNPGSSDVVSGNIYFYTVGNNVVCTQAGTHSYDKDKTTILTADLGNQIEAVKAALTGNSISEATKKSLADAAAKNHISVRKGLTAELFSFLFTRFPRIAHDQLEQRLITLYNKDQKQCQALLSKIQAEGVTYRNELCSTLIENLTETFAPELNSLVVSDGLDARAQELIRNLAYTIDCSNFTIYNISVKARQPQAVKNVNAGVSNSSFLFSFARSWGMGNNNKGKPVEGTIALPPPAKASYQALKL
jgi:hypothetical protein